MKTIVAGGRTFTDYTLVKATLDALQPPITLLISGGAKGADSLGERWAKENNIPVKQFLPNWGLYGVAAGPKRNAQMAQVAERLIAFWDGKSRGTQDMINQAKLWELPITIVEVPE